MALSKIQFRPGVDKEGTQYTADAGWFDSDKIRFRKGRVEKIGGWEKYSQNPIIGVPRSLRDFGTSNGSRYLGVGTNAKMYVEEGLVYQDITPIDRSTLGTATLGASAGFPFLLVTDVGSNASTGNYVQISGAIGLGGNFTSEVINSNHRIVSSVSPDQYAISVLDEDGNEVFADASDVGNGGNSISVGYEVAVGLNTYLPATGWGVSGWSAGGFGSTSPLTFVNQFRVIGQDAFGDNLVFNFRAGGVFIWQESVGGKAVALNTLGDNSAPDEALSVLVSEIDRHVICLGATPIGGTQIDPLLVRWSDQEDATSWFPSATNSAGGQVLSVGTEIVGSIKTRQEIIISTDSGLVSMRFVGAPFIYSFSTVSENASFIGPNASVVVGDVIYFMDSGGFYQYAGSVQRIPCTVHRHVFENINKTQRFKVFASANPDFSEVTWFYQVGPDTNDVTNYVTFNYMENLWSVGTLDRGSMIQTEAKEYPLAGSNNTVDLEDNYLYNHEIGFDADGEAMHAFVESGDLGIGDGDQFMHVNRIISDFDFSGAEADASIDVQIKGRNFPLESLNLLSTSQVNSSTMQSYVRTRARELVIRIESDGSGYGWSLGDMRFGIRTDGRR
jgi:hypothetical protein